MIVLTDRCSTVFLAPGHCRRDVARAGLCREERSCAPIGTIIRWRRLVLQRCGIGHSACVKRPGQCCRDAARGVRFRVCRHRSDQAP